MIAKLIKIVALAACLVNLNTQAGTIENYDDISVRDTQSGLIWMKNGVNNNVSYEQVVDALAQPNSEFYGWRLPSSSEVLGLWQNMFGDYEGWNICGQDCGILISTDLEAEFSNLLTLFNSSWLGGKFMYADYVGLASIGLGVTFDEFGNYSPVQIAAVAPSNWDTTAVNEWFTTLLVKKAQVAESSPVYLLIIGLAGLAWRRRAGT